MSDGRGLRLSGAVLVESTAVPLLARVLETERRRQFQVNGVRLVEPLQHLLDACVDEVNSRPLPAVNWVPSKVAAARLDVSGQAVRDMVRDGRLVGRLEGRLWFVEEASVAARASLRFAARAKQSEAKPDSPGETPFAKFRKAEKWRIVRMTS